MVDYDVIVCGAGPAGSTAAKTLSERGHNVALLDKDNFPRDKPCGGALRGVLLHEFPHVAKSLTKFPFVEAKRIRFHSRNLKEHLDFFPHEPIIYSIDRSSFDSMLVDQAMEAGANILEDTTVKTVKVLKEGAKAYLADGRAMTSKLVIGAGGMYDPVAKYLRKKEGLENRWPKEDIGLVMTKDIVADEEFIKSAYGEEMTHHFYIAFNGLRGYAWAFPKKGVINIGFGAFWNDMKAVDTTKWAGKFVSRLKSEGLLPKRANGTDMRGAGVPLRGPIKKTYSNRIMLVGDAAGFVSPLAGEGIYYAMKTGDMAAATASKALGQRRFSASVLKEYEDKWMSHWPGEFKALCYIADKVLANDSRVIRYGNKDPVMKEHYIRLISGLESAKMLKSKIMKRAFRDMMLYDVLRL